MVMPWSIRLAGDDFICCRVRAKPNVLQVELCALMQRFLIRKIVDAVLSHVKNPILDQLPANWSYFGEIVI